LAEELAGGAFALRGEQDHGGAAEFGGGGDGVREREAVGLRHLLVEKDDRVGLGSGGGALEFLQSGGGGIGDSIGDVPRVEDAMEDLPVGRIVVDDEDALLRESTVDAWRRRQIGGAEADGEPEQGAFAPEC
jgi:hypothetical protein